MPTYADIKIRQRAELLSSAVQGQTFTITLGSPVAAGSTLLLIGNALRADTYQASALNSVSSTVNGSAGNTWGTITNYDADVNGYGTKLWGVYAENASAGTTVVTGTLGVNLTQNLIGARLLEIEGVPTSSVAAFSPKTSRSTNSLNAYVDTDVTGTLPQTDCLLIGASGGSYGNPANDGDWTEEMSVSNGGGKVGFQIGFRKVTATTSVYMRTLHDSGVTASRGTLLYGFKAKEASTRQYHAQFNSTKLNNSHGALTAYVLVNGDCDQVLAKKFTNVTATAGGLVVCSPAPAGALTSDQIKIMVENATITSGWVAGSCVDA